MSRQNRESSHGSHDDTLLAETTPLLAPPLDETARGSDDRSIKAGDRQVRSPGPDEDVRLVAKQNIGTVRLVLSSLILGALVFLQATNVSMLTTTQSEIAADLDAFDQTSWMTSAYLIGMASMTPLHGKLTSVFSPRICVFVSALVLGLGTAICAVAMSFETFIIGRVIASASAGGIYTVSIAIVLELSSPKRRGVALGLLNTGYTFGVAVGATAAGALLPSVGWRALFWMQSPIAIALAFMIFFSIPTHFVSSNHKDDGDQSTLKRLAQLDYLGAATLTISIVLLLYPLSASRSIPILPLLLAAASFATFILIEIHVATDPIVPITLLRSRGLLLTCLGIMGKMMARWAVLFFTPTYALAVRQWSPATAGAMLIPTNTGFAIGGLAVGHFHIRRHGSFYLATVIVYALFPLTLLALAQLSHATSSPVLFVLVVFANGAITGAAVNYSLAHLLHLTPPSTHYVATALTATFRGFAGSFGSAIGGGVFTRALAAALQTHFAELGLQGRGDLIHRLLGSPALVEKLQGAEREGAVLGYQNAIRTLWLAAAGLAFAMVFIQAGTGWKVAREEEMKVEEGRRGLVGGVEDEERD